MNEHGIYDPRLNDASWLATEYQTRSVQSIADELGVARNTVRNRMIELGITRRTSGEHLKGKPKTAAVRAKYSEARRKHWQNLSEEEYQSHVLHISEGKRTKDGITPEGRRRIYVFGEGRVLEHRHVIEKAIGRPLRSDEQVHHIDGNPLNNEPSNLMVVSNLEHQALHAQKLTDEKVLIIRDLWEHGQMNQHELAKRFGVCVTTIHRIVHKQRWKHLP